MNQQRRNHNDAERVAILSVPAERIRPHFWTFSICFVVTLIFYTSVHVIIVENPSWEKTPSAVMGDTTRAGAFWLFASPILVEGAAMVFAAIFRQRIREESREEGREEGIARGRDEADVAWRQWNQRRLEAEANGEPFNELPPDFGNGSSADGN